LETVFEQRFRRSRVFAVACQFRLQLSNTRRKLFVSQFLGLPMLLRNADIAALNGLCRPSIADERLSVSGALIPPVLTA
jgi:hypothetical protein